MMETFEEIAKEFNSDKYISIDPEASTITFKIQDGPIKEVGLNGTQIDEIGRVWLSILEKFNEGKFRCRENSISITKITEALFWQRDRKESRMARGVEGTSEG